MKIITVVILSLCVGANHAMLTKMPSELQRVLAEGRNVTSLESFRRLIHVKKNDSTPFISLVDRVELSSTTAVIGRCPSSVKPTRCPVKVTNLCTDDSSCPSDLKCCNTGCRLDCVRPPAPSLRQESLVGASVDIQRVLLDNELCSPRPVVVQVPQPVNQAAIHFPFHVMLNRCGGSCNARPLVTNCEPQEQMELNVMVFRVAWTSSTDQLSDVAGDLVGVRMTNHTKCGCQCVTKPTDCDNKTQHYSRENCRCECKPQQVRCPFNHRWDPIKCECRCNPSSKAICGKRREFDDNRCACVCSSKSCRHNKVRDLTDCRCQCLHRKCSPGMIYDRRTCTCKGNIP